MFKNQTNKVDRPHKQTKQNKKHTNKVDYPQKKKNIYIYIYTTKVVTKHLISLISQQSTSSTEKVNFGLQL